MPSYLPYPKLKRQRAILVDGKHPHCLCLSHWKGANCPEPYKADTSAHSVLKAIASGLDVESYPWVTANHYDIDALLGVWALLHWEQALEYADLLRLVAELGDFRATALQHPLWKKALAIVCWLDAEEENFYPPFGQSQEARACEEKFLYFLPKFEELLQQGPKREEGAAWLMRYEEVLADLEVLRNEETEIRRFPQLGILWIRTPKPLGYYALCAPAGEMDSIVTDYGEQQYEIEHRYTSWVELKSRTALPRVPLQGLANFLQQYEEAEGCVWQGEASSETGPICYLRKKESAPWTAQERFASPKKRQRCTSSISPQDFEQLVLSYFEQELNRVR